MESDASPDVSTELAAALATDLVVGGITYVRPSPVTFQLRQYVFDEIDAAGILPLVTDPELTRDDDVLAAALVMQAYRSGRLFTLLAGLLVSTGATWTPPLAEATARNFEALADPAEADALAQRVLWLVLDFFQRSGPASAIFLKYMLRGVRRSNATGQAPPMPQPGASGATPDSATTPLSSAPSPITVASS